MSSVDLDFVGPMPPAATQSELTGYLGRAVQAIREGASIAGILRIGGAGLMVFSLSLFLMQGMEATSDLHRYMLLLGQTVLLTAAGFAVGLVLKEPRGARVFFSLALVSIPANFAVLGAMIYSVAPLDAMITEYPTYAKWQSTNVKELFIAGVAGLVVLVPMSVFCFAVLARKSKWWLTAAYLAASATLLIPLRETVSVTLISSVCALGVLALLSYRRAKGQGLATGEENFAKALLFIPPALMLSRSAMLYSVDFHFVLAVVIAAYYLLRRVVIARVGNTGLTNFLQTLTVFTSFILSIMLSSLIGENISFSLPILVFATAWLGLNVELARFLASEKVVNVVHATWASVCFLVVILDLGLFNYGTGFFVELMLALVLLVASVLLQQNLGKVLGSMAVILVLLVNGSNVIAMVLNTGWVGMAIAGGTTIVAGSMLEKFWPIVKIRLSNRFTSKTAKAFDTAELEQQDATSAGAKQSIAA